MRSYQVLYELVTLHHIVKTFVLTLFLKRFGGHLSMKNVRVLGKCMRGRRRDELHNYSVLSCRI